MRPDLIKYVCGCLLVFWTVVASTGCPAQTPPKEKAAEAQPKDAGTADAQPIDTTARDTGTTRDDRPKDAGPADRAPQDKGAVDTANPDNGPTDIPTTPDTDLPEPTKETTQPDKVGGIDGTTPESSNKTCSYNSDCPTQERCECDENTGCFCKFGTRGTGKNGVDVCTNGNDCETALCVEGSDGKYYCSGECKSENDCKEKLPICANISFVGQICIRKKS